VADEQSDRILYSTGRPLGKTRIFLNSLMVRTQDWLRAADYDIVFIYREALMTRHLIFEQLFANARARIVFDFDDAIWLPAISDGNRRLGWLKNHDKTRRIIECADMVFAGNQYLATYASQFSDCVQIVPTTIDTNVFKPRPRNERADEPIEIGWTGSATTIEYFRLARGILRRLRDKYGDRVRFKVIGDQTYEDRELGIRGKAWKLASEVDDLGTLDIGIMPLPDTDWTRGKCGLKALAYMALAVPAVASPVGINTEIISDGVNGLLAKDEDEWVEKLSRLIEQPELRAALGQQGRETVVARYSTLSQQENYLMYFNEVLDAPAARRVGRRQSRSMTVVPSVKR
jgi:glycosyltransferase involved in cell wall biosynthesis